MSVHFVPLPVSTGPRAGGAPPPLGHMVSCKYVCMYVRLCCCKYLSWVPGQLQKRLLREEEAPLCLLVTAWHRGRPDSPSPGSSPLQGCSYPTCVHLPHTLTTENRVSGSEQTAPGAGGGAVLERPQRPPQLWPVTTSTAVPTD